MKKLLVLFTVMFSISLFCSDVNAQCSSKENVNIGQIRVGETFELFLSSGDSHIWCSPTLRYEGTSGNYAIYRYMGDLNILEAKSATTIGEVTFSSRNGYKCHVIYAEVIQ
ncbi:MAG: hypothetical protein E6772_01365 [Dysgonomonas sp.]|nr:hypothetical protein [Dysgonomonas sp.]